MATTTNYGWSTPDDTSLVKDGAAAIRTLGSSVDTTTKALNPSTTLGDIEYRSATANTNTRLGIGSTGNILTVSGGVPVWSAPAGGGGITSLATGSLTGTAVNLTSISQAYSNLVLVLRDWYPAADAEGISLRINSVSSGSFYYGAVIHSVSATVANTGPQNAISINNGDRNPKNEDNNNAAIFTFYDYTNATTAKLLDANFVYKTSTTNQQAACNGGFAHNPTTPVAITELNILCTGTGFGGGSYQLYGVK